MATLTLTRGDSREWSSRITKPDANGDEQPYPIEGTAEIRFTMKASTRDADANALVALSWISGVEDGIFVDDAPNGEYRVKVTPAETSDLEAGRFPYDVQLKDSTGTFTIDRGTVLVEADVTQAA